MYKLLDSKFTHCSGLWHGPQINWGLHTGILMILANSAAQIPNLSECWHADVVLLCSGVWSIPFIHFRHAHADVLGPLLPPLAARRLYRGILHGSPGLCAGRPARQDADAARAAYAGAVWRALPVRGRAPGAELRLAVCVHSLCHYGGEPQVLSEDMVPGSKVRIHLSVCTQVQAAMLLARHMTSDLE